MPVGSIFGAERYKPKAKKKASVPGRPVGVKGSILMEAYNKAVSIMKSYNASANVFSARARARALVNKQKKQTSAVPLIARTTSASPDNVAGLNRPYIQVLSLGADPGMKDATKLKSPHSNLYDTFIINSVNLVDAEKLDVVETFGNPHFFSSGRFTKKAVISGVVRSQARTPMISMSGESFGRTEDTRRTEIGKTNKVPDYVVFRNFYEKYLRATLQASSNTFTRFYVDGDYYDGFVQNLAFNITAESEQTIPWSMSMLLIRSWNAEDRSAASILSEFMDDLKIERTPITDREALLELQDTKGTGKITINGVKIHTTKEITYVAGRTDNTDAAGYLELDGADSVILGIEVPEGLDGVVTLVRNDKNRTEISGSTIRKSEKVYVFLKLERVAALSQWIDKNKNNTSDAGTVPSDVRTCTVPIKVFDAQNKEGGCSINFPLKLSKGEELKITEMILNNPITLVPLELKGKIEKVGEIISVHFVVPQEKQQAVFESSVGRLAGDIVAKLSDATGKGLKIADTSKVQVSMASILGIMTAVQGTDLPGELDSKEDITEIANPLNIGPVINKSGLMNPENSTLEYRIESENPGFANIEKWPVNPTYSSPAISYTFNHKYIIPGFVETPVSILITVQMPTPEALKDVVNGKLETRVTGSVIDILVPVSSASLVDDPKAPSGKNLVPLAEKLVSALTVKSTVVVNNQFTFTANLVLSKGSKATYTCSRAAFTGTVIKSGTFVAGGYYVWRATLQFTHPTVTSYTYTLSNPIVQDLSK